MEYEPGKQRLQLVELGPAKLPISHSVHVKTTVAPATVENVPAEQL